MSKNLVRLSQVPVGATFKYFNALYKKICQVQSGCGKGRDYRDNCIRLDNGKTLRLQGSWLVEVISYDNETKN